MSDAMPESTDAAAPRPTTAGGLLRQARQAQGLHIAALAAAIKVVPRKLELLESDQFDQLPDATFTRALAQTVCRTLKIDAVPILALMPPPRSHRLEQVASGLNTPFHERPGRLVPKEWASVAMPAVVLAALLLIAAVVIYLMPPGWSPLAKGAFSRAAASEPAATPARVTETVVLPPAATPAASAPAEVASAAATTDVMPPVTIEAETAPPAPVIAATGVLQLQPSEASWVEVIDARGKPLISRLVQPGESVGLDGVMPFKVKIGNANATQVVFRGQPLELGPFTRDNMAKLELR
jgi:cytoskeleton protein RodZ